VSGIVTFPAAFIFPVNSVLIFLCSLTIDCVTFCFVGRVDASSHVLERAVNTRFVEIFDDANLFLEELTELSLREPTKSRMRPEK
jgi:hypothetical protein